MSAVTHSRRSHPQAGSHIPPQGPQQHCLRSQPGWLQTLALTFQRLLTKLMALCASASASRTGKNSPSLLGPCDLGTNRAGYRSQVCSSEHSLSVGSSPAGWVLYKGCVGGHPASSWMRHTSKGLRHHMVSVNIICSVQVAQGKGVGLRDWAVVTGHHTRR